jgi:hypothetical protein
VIKSFVLVKDKQNNLSVCEDVDGVKGTSFSKGDGYVDYKSHKKEIPFTSITEILITKGFIKLISQINP